MATQKGDIYECRECGNRVKIIEAGAGALECCDEPMRVQREQKTSADFMQAFGGDFKGRTLQ